MIYYKKRLGEYMKKLFSAVFSIALALCICFSVSGCQFIRDSGTIDDIPSAIEASNNVTFGTLYDSVSSPERQEMKLKDAVSLVKRSSVAIYMQNSAASGVLVDFADGSVAASDDFIYIITCFHVIESKGVINVFVPDKDYSYDNLGYIYAGVIGNVNATPTIFTDVNNVPVDNAVTLIGGDKYSDIAVLKLDVTKKTASGETRELSDFVTAKLPPVDYTVVEGEEVFAIGNPTGLLPGSVCSGIVSKVNSEATFEGIGTMKLMQIDATINPGNSGGGLYNLFGELIAITNGGNTSYEAINFAIPMHVEYDGFKNGFVDIAKQLIGSYNAINANGFINYGYVEGRSEVMGFTVTKEVIVNKEYVVVTSVNAGSQASLKGLQVKDNIVEVLIETEENTFVSEDFETYEQFTQIMNQLKFSEKRFKLVANRLRGFTVQSVILGDSEPFQYKQYIFCDTGNYKAQ